MVTPEGPMVLLTWPVEHRSLIVQQHFPELFSNISFIKRFPFDSFCPVCPPQILVLQRQPCRGSRARLSTGFLATP